MSDTWAIQADGSLLVSYGLEADIRAYADVCLRMGEGFRVWRVEE